MRISSLTVCGFRGFNVEQTISLDAEVVVIYGQNGAGKSSLAEALEWLFFGEISRKERSFCSGQYTGAHLRNVHYEGDGPPFVEALTFCQGRTHVVRREWLSATKSRLVVDGNEVQDLSCLPICIEPSAKPILGQSEIKRFVDTEEKDR